MGDDKESSYKPTTGANLNQVAEDFIPTKIDHFDSYMEELFCQGSDSNRKVMAGSLSSPVRNEDALPISVCSKSEHTIWQNLVVPVNTETTGHQCKHAVKPAKADSQNPRKLKAWTSPEREHQTGKPVSLDTEQKETLETLIVEASSSLEKYMTKQTFGMEAQPSHFDSSTNLMHLNATNGSTWAQQCAFPGGFSAHLPYAAGEQMILGQNNHLPHAPQIKADPGDLPPVAEDSAVEMNVMDYTQSLAMQCRVAPGNAFWCQSGLSEDQHRDATSGSPCRTTGASDTFTTYIGMLPQRVCFICGDEASGCHYGVLTCGSCKVFFKRAVEGHQKYLCAGRNDCIVDKIRRKNCPACRLRKCFQAGMMLGGRKLKKFGTLKAMGLTQALAVPSLVGRSYDSQSLPTVACIPAVRELRFSPQIISILENIEPEVVYSGYDNSQPELPHLLLNSLNRLCERQLLWIVRWSKSLPGFRSLHINDQMSLIQYSWMSLMLFSLGWRSFQNVTREYLYFAPDLVLHEDRMRQSPISDLCIAMQFIPQEFANLQVTKEEFLCMKALILLNTVPLEGLKSQEQFEAMRQSYIQELSRAIQLKERGVLVSSQRFYHLTKLMDAMHEIVKKVNLYCLTTFIQADTMHVEFPEMMSEVIASHLPKILAGMVKPLLFHTK